MKMKMKMKITAYEVRIDFDGSTKDYLKIMEGVKISFPATVDKK